MLPPQQRPFMPNQNPNQPMMAGNPQNNSALISQLSTPPNMANMNMMNPNMNAQQQQQIRMQLMQQQSQQQQLQQQQQQQQHLMQNQQVPQGNRHIQILSVSLTLLCCLRNKNGCLLGWIEVSGELSLRS
jgi:hypothetical protein